MFRILNGVEAQRAAAQQAIKKADDVSAALKDAINKNQAARNRLLEALSRKGSEELNGAA